jgi:hypothetical protein
MRKKLAAKYTKQCSRCKHATAAHKGGKRCAMKHCSCKEFRS